MAKYLLTCDVKSTRGSQTYRVEAADEAEALAKYNAGDCEFVEQEIEVTDLGEPEVELDEE